MQFRMVDYPKIEDMSGRRIMEYILTDIFIYTCISIVFIVVTSTHEHRYYYTSKK